MQDILFGSEMVKNSEIWHVTWKKCDGSSTDCHCNGLLKGRRTLSLKLWIALSFTDPNCWILQILGKPLLAGQHRISLSLQSSVVTHPASTINELLSNVEKHWVLHGILAVGLNVSTEQSAWFEHGQHLWPPAELKYNFEIEIVLWPTRYLVKRTNIKIIYWVISLQYGINLNSKTQKTDSEEMYNIIYFICIYCCSS